MSDSDYLRLKLRINSFIKHNGSKVRLDKITSGEFIDIINQSKKLFPEYENFFKRSIASSYNKYNYMYIHLSAVKEIMSRIFSFIDLEEKTNSQLNKKSVFDSAFDRVKMASDSLQKDEKQSVFNHLNSAIELILKEKLNIPSTYRNIKTTNVIEILVKEKIGPYRYLDEAKNRVTLIDNQVKHHGYSPSKPESIRALKITEELLSKIKDVNIKLPIEVENKIFREL